ncbi:hypothetical protein R1flu_018841 [Riccia fluitans]|uniref:Uncharacterized protein n=1 Tax=Riccia fluitans TaxID=41844 RepID=A0ABD1ZGZ4_9MARC
MGNRRTRARKYDRKRDDGQLGQHMRNILACLNSDGKKRGGDMLRGELQMLKEQEIQVMNLVNLVYRVLIGRFGG